jgi:hypothetical protein
MRSKYLVEGDFSMKIKVWMGITLACLMFVGALSLTGTETVTKIAADDPPIPIGSPEI